MSRFRFYIFPRLCLALSALVLLGGLWVLWLSMGRPMPTQGLACRQAETARFLPHGTTSASGPLRYENGVWFGKADAWAVRRAGDSFTLMELERTAGLLWRSEAIMDITPSRWGEAIWAFPAGLDYYDVFQEGSLDSETWSEFTPVAVSDDPRVAQVEVTAVWVGDEERDAPAAALAELGRKGSPGAFLRAVSRHKTGADGGDDPAFALYQEKLEGKLDFDDLLLETLRQWEGGRSDRRFTHLLVDEFQDIDRLQLRLLRAWRREGGTFFAIGDPDQSIYGFRGADAGCFSALGAERTVRLTENYRSPPEILAAALPVTEAIDGAPRRMETHSPHGAEVRLLTAEGDRAEAIFVAKEIARMVGGIGMLEAQALGAARGARSFGDIAVLYRTRRQAALLEECLAHDGIPCVVTGREDFLLDGEVQAALAWLEGQQEEGKSPAALLEEWTAHHTPSGGVERLRNMAVFFGDVPAFLRNLTIGQEGDLLRRAGLSYAAGAVTLSTLHGAKGLEWPVVFLCGVGEGRIPLERKGLDTDEAEERRLLYVGMTRAREELVLLSGGEPSRFLAGLPLRQDPAHAPVPRPLGVQLSLFK